MTANRRAGKLGKVGREVTSIIGGTFGEFVIVGTEGFR